MHALGWSAYWAGALPLAALVVLLVTGRERPAAFWWVAAAFAVSVVADRVSRSMGGVADPSFYYRPVQIGLVLFAFKTDVIERGMLAAILALSGWLSWSVVTAPAELAVTACGSIVICGAAWQERWLRGPLWTYFWLGTLAYLWMVPTIGTEAIVPRWVAYQTCRIVALVWFVVAVARWEDRRAWVI